MGFFSVAGAGVSFGESLWGESFTYAGSNYSGTIADVRGEGRLVFTGIEDFADLIIEAKKAQFASAPVAAPRSLLVARGLNWRVVAVTSDELTYTLTCKLQS